MSVAHFFTIKTVLLNSIDILQPVRPTNMCPMRRHESKLDDIYTSSITDLPLDEEHLSKQQIKKARKLAKKDSKVGCLY